MRKFVVAGAAALAIAMSAGAASAKDLPAGGLTIEELASWMQSKGLTATIAKSSSGERYIQSSAEDVNFDVWMMDCGDKPRCASIEIQAGFDMSKGTTLKVVNDWNGSKRYVTSWLDNENDPWIKMEINLSPGVTYEALEDNFGVWVSMIPDFKTHINW